MDGIQRMTLGRDPPVVRTRLLHESEQTRVTRLVFRVGSVIQKEPLGPGAQARLRHEVEILERLAGAEGVAQLAAQKPLCVQRGSVLLADVDGTALSERTTPLDAAELAELAASLARAVAGMHRRGVVHWNINPANVVVSGGRAAPNLIDFALATTFPTVQPGFVHLTELVGTLPYLAPEQTGRTGRPVDHRADLYALGATLYELATGAPPFGTGDPLRMIHDHLTRVPVPPEAVNPALPPGLSAIIMHLLEKEPDDRYQSADGLVHDLGLVRQGAEAVRPGQHDLPVFSLLPSRLAGREEEIGELGAAFAEAMAGRCSGLVIGGASGVGKTALVHELRPIVAGCDGWFVSGKFDQYRRDQEYDAVRQAFRALGRLLLAEPEDYLVELRGRMLEGLGPNAGLVSAVVPELAAFLKVPPEPGDPMTAQVRLERTAVEVLRAVASRKRPVVFVVDDLQWAGRTPLGFVDLILGGEEQVEGLLLVGAYREGEVDAAHPLTPMLARWRRQAGAHVVRLGNLSPEGQTAMVADLLRVGPESAAELARLIAPVTRGNPYDTVELLGALRRDGVLAPADTGWRWNQAALSGRLARVDVTALLADRLAAMPPNTREMLEVMAGLAGRVDLDLLAASTGLEEDEVERRLAPAFADGFLVLESDGRPSARFHHDRAQAFVLSGIAPRTLRATRLRVARRLADRGEYFTVAAEQYLPVADAVHAAGERRLVAGLFRRAADEAKVLSNYLLVERLLTASVALLDPTDTDQLITVHTERHAALYSLGRLQDADEAYVTISRLCTRPVQRTAATVVQVSSLTNRKRSSEAMRLGLDQLRQLGISVPERDALDAEIDRGLDVIYQWIDQTSESDDLRRPAITERSRLGAFKLISRLMPPAFFCDQAMMAWLTVTTLEMWARYGPDPSLVGSASHASVVTVARRGDYRTGCRVLRRILAVSRARGYEPEVWHAQFLYVISTGHWFDPLEDCVGAARCALEGLLRGDLQNGCWAYSPLLHDLLDCTPSLDVLVTEVDEAVALAVRTGNDQAEEAFRTYRQLVRVLRGEGAASAAEEAARLSMLADDRLNAAYLRVTRALAAAVLDRPAELERHTAAAMPLLSAVEAQYPVAIARLLRALSLAAQARATQTARRVAILAELDEQIAWLSARAVDAPINFGHLLRLAEAERAWAAGNFREASYTYDAAQREVSARARPWHRALILERSARFFLAHGMEQTGNTLVAGARRQYLAWGATAKVSQLDWAYPTLRAEPAGAQPATGPPAQPAAQRSTVTTGTIDLLGIVTASQALSSETNIDGLQARVVGILSAMTGATRVHLLLRDQNDHCWRLVTSDGGTVTLEDAGRRRLLPLSVIWYAERTHEPLVVADATHDDRFARDSYVLDLDRCSLLAVPIMIRGQLRAMLLLENRMIHGAFTTDRLEGIMLIAGQLAVSLENALVYTSLERKVAERTQQLAAANQRLEQLSITDPLTGLANRRCLEDVLDSAWSRARQQAAPLAFAMIDIDHFKLYNDHFGHSAGDRCLRQVATRLADITRSTDLVARYGGEEFAVVMPDTDNAAAARLARRLCSAIVELAEPHPLVPSRIVTVSIGVAAATPTPGSAPASLVDLADAALYRAKGGGRNRVEA